MANPVNSTATNDVFDVRRIRRLVELMHENDLSEINLQQGELRIQLCRATGPAVVIPAVAQTPAAMMAAAPPAAALGQNAPPAAVKEEHFEYIKSPMVGTFYAATNPESPPFVRIGDLVHPEKTVCLIEAMKVFNEIPAEIPGKIVEVLAKNGEAVEFGRPLFKIAPQG